MAADSRKLQLSKHAVETLIKSFPAELMTLDRLDSYSAELKEIRDRFLEFSTQVMTYALTFLNCDDPPKSVDGADMNVDYWNTAEHNLQSSMNTHQLEIRQIASSLHQNKGMSEFERQDLELKKKQFELLEKSSVKA